MSDTDLEVMYTWEVSDVFVRSYIVEAETEKEAMELFLEKLVEDLIPDRMGDYVDIVRLD